jgi:arsenate reductase (thioredoxin)
MNTKLYPQLNGCVGYVLENYPVPTGKRSEQLGKIVDYLRSHSDRAELIFVCTHNSRRSHMGQFWAAAAAAYYNIPIKGSYSAGTEATAMHPNTLEALVACGFEIDTDSASDSNPHYAIKLGGLLPVYTGFSKTLQDESLPKSDFCAVLVCSEADAACPFVPGAAARIPLPFEDPKSSDNTPLRQKTYLTRCQEIAREILWVFEQVAAIKP